MPFLNRIKNLESRIMYRSQKGVIAQALLLLLLVTGIGLGIYLVGQRTNLLPKATEAGPVDYQLAIITGVYGNISSNMKSDPIVADQLGQEIINYWQAADPKVRILSSHTYGPYLISGSLAYANCADKSVSDYLKQKAVADGLDLSKRNLFIYDVPYNFWATSAKNTQCQTTGFHVDRFSAFLTAAIASGKYSDGSSTWDYPTIQYLAAYVSSLISKNGAFWPEIWRQTFDITDFENPTCTLDGQGGVINTTGHCGANSGLSENVEFYCDDQLPRHFSDQTSCKTELQWRTQAETACRSCAIVPTPLGCTDTDGERNYSVAGSVNLVKKYGDYQSGELSAAQDVCDTNDEAILHEAYCDNNQVKVEEKVCDFACKNGACITQEQANNANNSCPMSLVAVLDKGDVQSKCPYGQVEATDFVCSDQLARDFNMPGSCRTKSQWWEIAKQKCSACETPPRPVGCFETDNDVDPFVKGKNTMVKPYNQYQTGDTTSAEDVCGVARTSDTLYEKYCQNGLIYTKEINCEIGCTNGACNKPVMSPLPVPLPSALPSTSVSTSKSKNSNTKTKSIDKNKKTNSNYNPFGFLFGQ